MRYNFFHILKLSATVAALCCSCQRGALDPVSAGEECILSLDGDLQTVVGTRAAAVSSMPSRLTFGGARAGGAKIVDAANITVSGGTKLYTGYYCETESCDWFVTNAAAAALNVSSGTVTVADNATDIIAGAALNTTSHTPTVSLGHLFARTGSVSLTCKSDYTVTSATWSMTPYVSGIYNLRTARWTGSTSQNTTFGSASDLYIVPGTYRITVDFTLKRNGSSSSENYSKSGNVTFAQGKITDIAAVTDEDPLSPLVLSCTVEPWLNSSGDPDWDLQEEQGEAFDLSLYNPLTNAAISRTTANCYLITPAMKAQASTFSFPLVFGNGLKDGSANDAAYRSNALTFQWEVEFLPMSAAEIAVRNLSHTGTTYKGADDRLITGPWLKDHYSDKNFTAILLWIDTPGLISNIEYHSENGGYISFSLNGSEGNALVGVRNAANGVCWSWHIWVSANAPSFMSGGFSDIYSLPVGCTASNNGGMYYQWGRKDPFPGDGTGSYIKDFDDGSGLYEEGAKSTAWLVSHPTTFIGGEMEPWEEGDDYISALVSEDTRKGFHNRWNTPLNRDRVWLWTENDMHITYREYYPAWEQPVVKTINDPCPIGLNVAVPSLFFNSEDVSHPDTGFTFNRYGGELQPGSFYWDEEAGMDLPSDMNAVLVGSSLLFHTSHSYNGYLRVSTEEWREFPFETTDNMAIFIPPYKVGYFVLAQREQ